MASPNENNIYLAGLLDGEGCVTYKKYWDRKRKDRPRKYFCWRIQMEIVMTHEPTIQWCADNFGGKVYKKPRGEHKMQYRWRRCFRDALKIAKAIIPYSITKKEKLQQVIDHYEDDTPEYRGGGAYRAMLKLFAQHRAESGKTSTPVVSATQKRREK